MEFLQVAIGLAILLILYKMNIIKLPGRLFFRHRYSAKKLMLKYRLFNGGYHHNFLVDKGNTYTIQYDVRVEKGSVLVRMKNAFEKTFDSDEAGSAVFTADHRIQSIFVEGDATNGHCKIKLKEIS